jgi:carbohydrate-binding DOMON domain-containing protein
VQLEGKTLRAYASDKELSKVLLALDVRDASAAFSARIRRVEHRATAVAFDEWYAGAKEHAHMRGVLTKVVERWRNRKVSAVKLRPAVYLAHTHTHTHTYTHKHARTHTHTHTHASTHARTRARTHTHKHALTHAHTHVHTHTRTRHIKARMIPDTHTQTYTHTRHIGCPTHTHTTQDA